MSTESPSSRLARAADPEFFHGDRAKLDEFLAQLTIKFLTNPELFPTEISKVGYASSFLRGPAFKVYSSFMREDVLPYTNYQDFKAFMKQNESSDTCSKGTVHALSTMRSSLA
ncbi:hypothetical protein V1512DRAFT_255604 [Lipomyces arxii]|uniref:uncharacterized protein n=1 Tax=Lipomyces arxii TaxID=56418 RepID=UPI0034CE5085